MRCSKKQPVITHINKKKHNWLPKKINKYMCNATANKKVSSGENFFLYHFYIMTIWVCYIGEIKTCDHSLLYRYSGKKWYVYISIQKDNNKNFVDSFQTTLQTYISIYIYIYIETLSQIRKYFIRIRTYARTSVRLAPVFIMHVPLLQVCGTCRQVLYRTALLCPCDIIMLQF